MTESQSSGEKLQPRHPYIEIVGPVGVGKSYFASTLRQMTGVSIFDEPYVDNPYLKGFYEESPNKYSFNSQVYFLTQDGLQATKINSLLLTEPIVQDAGRVVNRIIAAVHRSMGWMTDKEYTVYHAIDQKVYDRIPEPDVYVAITASKETVIRRIRDRANRDEKRRGELTMLEKYPRYFETLVEEFEKWLEKTKSTQMVAEVNTDDPKFSFENGEISREQAVREGLSWAGYYIYSQNRLNCTGKDGRKIIFPDFLR